MQKPTAEDLNWFAGLMEGEGWFGLTNHNSRQLRMQVSLVDKDVIDRVHAMFPFGSRGQRQLPSGKHFYDWVASKQDDVVDLMDALLPLMGDRRRAQIMRCLAEWEAKPPPRRHWTHCARGHPLSGDNLRIAMDGKYEKRRCRVCERMRSYKSRSKMREAPKSI